MPNNTCIDCLDLQNCSSYPAVTAFYDRFRERITGIETVEQRNDILSDMQQDFEAEVRQEPQNQPHGNFTRNMRMCSNQMNIGKL